MTSSSLPEIANLTVRVASGEGLDVRRFTVEDQVSALFSIDLVVMSSNDNIDFDAVVGQPASFTMAHRAGQRTWTGIVNHLQQVRVADGEEGLSTYHLTIVPVLWLATQRKNYRIFQQVSELSMVQKLLAEWGIDPELRLVGTYKRRKYRVQYGESDFAFMSRMLEDAGISFFFVDASGESRLVLTDAPQAADARAPIAFRDQPTDADREHVTRVRYGQRVRPGRYTMQDHDYRLPPSYKLASTAAQTNVSQETRLERFQYTPGAFLFGTDKGEDTPAADDRGKTRSDEREGELLAKKRLDAKRSSAKVCTFDTSAHDLSAGMVVRFLDHPASGLAPDRRWLILSSRIAGTPHDAWQHTCEARSAAAAFRPPLATPKPKVSGVENATVVGPDGEEIHTDEFGRVRVHFHWDRESKMDESSSCWIHVSQPWSGARFGATSLPRVGQEVIVDFLGGDPDRPVIVGRMFTNLQRTPYKLPENKTQSGWQSRSSPGGSGDNYNEIMFEDKKGQELFRMQAEKDLHKLVKNDEGVTIGHDRSKKVGHDDEHHVGHDRARTVGHDEAVSIGNDRTRRVGNNEGVTIGNSRSKKVGANESLFVGVDQDETIGKDRSVKVGTNHTELIGGRMTLTVGLASTEVVGAAKTLTVGDAYAITVGDACTLTVGDAYQVTVSGAMTTHVALDQTESIKQSKTVTAGDKITITCGESTITMDKAGTIVLSGKDIQVEAKGTVNVNAKGTVNVESAATVNVKGSTIAMN